MKSSRIILASASPRRKELLGDLIDEFEVCPTNSKEIEGGFKPSVVVTKNAKAKAEECREKGIVIGADTVVYYNGKFYLKPKSQGDAFQMLKQLSGRTHFVYTGVCVKTETSEEVFYEKSSVKLKKLSDDEIKEYILQNNPLDKAGAYGIQDRVVVESFSGSYKNIVGLPMEKLAFILKRFGF